MRIISNCPVIFNIHYTPYKPKKGLPKWSVIKHAKECGVNPEVVMLWVGHEHDQDVRTSKGDRGYTTYSEEYLLGEVHKIEYDL